MGFRRNKRALLVFTVVGLLHNFAVATEYIVRSPNASLFEFSASLEPQFKVMNLEEAQVQTLKESGLVLEKNQNWYLQKFSTQSTALPINEGDGNWGINYIQSPQANLLDLGNGEGVTVCVVDTGVNTNHPSLQSRIVEAYDVTQSKLNAAGLLDPMGHGTMIASLIAGNSSKEHRGVAPGTKIVSVKVFADDSNGGTTTDLLVKGISYCLDKSQVINISLGGGAKSEILSEVIHEATRRGISVFAAAGGSSGPIMYPAAEPGVIAVGAVDKNLRVSDFSSRGPELGAVAPGVGVLVADSAGGYVNASGTSFSAAFASGVEAIRRSRGAKQLGYINLNVSSELQGKGMVHALLTASKIRD
jgi:subtilisin family serine protease